MGPTAADISNAITNVATNPEPSPTAHLSLIEDESNTSYTDNTGQFIQYVTYTAVGVILAVMLCIILSLLICGTLKKNKKVPPKPMDQKIEPHTNLENEKASVTLRRSKSIASQMNRNSMRATIPQEGKTLAYGNYVVKFPPGAVEKDVSIWLSTIPGENITKGKKRHFSIGETLRFEPSGIKFKKKFTVEFRSSYSAIENTVPVKVFVRKDHKSKWKLESETSISTDGKLMYTADHFCDRATEPLVTDRPLMKRLLWTQTYCKSLTPDEKELIWYVGPHCSNVTNVDYERVIRQFTNEQIAINFQTFSVQLDREIHLSLNPSQYPDLTIDPTTLQINHDRLNSDDTIHKTCNIKHNNLTEDPQITKVGYTIMHVIREEHSSHYTRSTWPPTQIIVDKLPLSWPGVEQRRLSPLYPTTRPRPIEHTSQDSISSPPSYNASYNNTAARRSTSPQIHGLPACRHTSNTTTPISSLQSTLLRPNRLDVVPNPIPLTTDNLTSVSDDSGARERLLSDNVFEERRPGNVRRMAFMFEASSRLEENPGSEPRCTQSSRTRTSSSINERLSRDFSSMTKHDGRFSYTKR